MLVVALLVWLLLSSWFVRIVELQSVRYWFVISVLETCILCSKQMPVAAAAIASAGDGSHTPDPDVVQ